jgi:lipid-A-disaccharide synthase
VIHVKYISLVNLIMDRPVLSELIQHDLTKARLTTELNEILGDSVKRKNMLDAYRLLREKLGGQGASGKAAGLMIRYLAGHHKEIK